MTATIDHPVNGSVYTGPDRPAPYVPSFTEQAAAAEATRVKAAAEADTTRKLGDVEAEAARVRVADEAASRATTQNLKTARAAAEIAQRQAEADAITREAKRKAKAEDKADRAAAAAERAEQAEQQRREALVATAEKRARTLVTVSVLIALPIQLAAFYLMSPYLVIVPLGLEYAAWVMLAMVDAAVAERRRTWHYIAATLIVATFAAAMNWAHGPDLIPEGGELVGAAAAFFSLLGPGTWALHTHGKISKRDGRPSRAQRKAARKAAEAAARQERERRLADEAAADELDARRFDGHPEVYARAAYIASAIGELTISEDVWCRAWHDVKGEGLPLGETAESIAQRKAASDSVRAALDGDDTPLPVVLQDGRIRVYKQPAMPQVAAQMPPAPKRLGERGKPKPPRRQKGDTPRYSEAARRAASITAKNTRKK